jgi:hypothetical protein
LLIYTLHLTESMGLMSDVKLQHAFPMAHLVRMWIMICCFYVAKNGSRILM